MKTTVSNYRKDKYYPRVVRAVATILSHSDVIAPVDVMIEMGNLSKKNHEDWRRGRVNYLERVFEGNLSKANRILKIIGFHAHDLNMVAKKSSYHQFGKGKNRLLRFSKSGEPKIEESYSRHFLWNQSQDKKQECLKWIKK